MKRLLYTASILVTVAMLASSCEKKGDEPPGKQQANRGKQDVSPAPATGKSGRARYENREATPEEAEEICEVFQVMRAAGALAKKKGFPDAPEDPARYAIECIGKEYTLSSENLATVLSERPQKSFIEAVLAMILVMDMNENKRMPTIGIMRELCKRGPLPDGSFAALWKEAQSLVIKPEGHCILIRRPLTDDQVKTVMEALVKSEDQRYEAKCMIEAAVASYDRTVPQLVKLVKHKDAEIAGFSAWVLGKIAEACQASRKDLPSRKEVHAVLSASATRGDLFAFPNSATPETVGDACADALKKVDPSSRVGVMDGKTPLDELLKNLCPVKESDYNRASRNAEQELIKRGPNVLKPLLAKIRETDFNRRDYWLSAGRGPAVVLTGLADGHPSSTAPVEALQSILESLSKSIRGGDPPGSYYSLLVVRRVVRIVSKDDRLAGPLRDLGPKLWNRALELRKSSSSSIQEWAGRLAETAHAMKTKFGETEPEKPNQMP